MRYRSKNAAAVGQLAVRDDFLEPGINRVERLAGNVGYIRIAQFTDPQSFSKQVDGAMLVLSSTRALIVDVRDSPGGSSRSVAYLSSHFFEPTERVHLNSFIYRFAPTVTEWTRSVPHPYLHRKVIVLTNRGTGPAAEGFAYQMQAFGRARIVGERSKGGAHAGNFVTVGRNFAAFIPTSYSWNPKTRTNWEKTGVLPDIPVSTDITLETALRALRT